MKRNNLFSTSRLQLLFMLLAMVLLVACGNGKNKKSADDDDEDETEMRAETGDDDFDEDYFDEDDYDVDDMDEDDVEADGDYVEVADDSELSVASLFSVFYKTLTTGDLDYCAKQLLAKGLSFDGERDVDGEEYMMFSHPDYGDFYVGITNDLPYLHVRYFSGDVSEEDFFKEARSRGFSEVEHGVYSDGKCTISWSVDGFFFRKN